MFECTYTLLLELYLNISRLMIASVLSSPKDQLPTGSKRNSSCFIPFPAAVTPYSTDLVPVSFCILGTGVIFPAEGKQ